MPGQQEKCETFDRLHRGDECFVIPNPHDSAYQWHGQALGAKALATTSAGFAMTLGRRDGAVTLEEKLDHCAAIAAAIDVPVNVDFEDGYGESPEAVAESVSRLIQTGVAGCSIEDFDRNRKTLFDMSAAVERLQAAVEAAAASGLNFQVTARAENLLRGVNDLDDTVARLLAYEKAGVQVLYAPGLKTLDEIKLVVSEVALPINVLGVFFPTANVVELSEAGAKRISVGSGFSNLAMGPVISAGRELLNEGTFGWMAGMPADLNQLLTGKPE